MNLQYRFSSRSLLSFLFEIWGVAIKRKTISNISRYPNSLTSLIYHPWQALDERLDMLLLGQ